MQQDLDGKVAIVTGGARGIGRAYAQGLAAAGATVVIADLREEEGRATVAAIEGDGGRAGFERVDVGDPSSVQAMAAAAVELGGGIDILVNNAAMFASLHHVPLSEMSVERWDLTMAINVRGPLLCIQAVAPSMRERGGGAIVNQSSIAALGMYGLTDYATSKAALIGMTKNLALELGADNIRVNAIAPGGTATEGFQEVTGQTDFSDLEQRAKTTNALRSHLEPEDLVGTVLYLVSSASRLVTGQTVVVDGGRYFLG